MTWEYVAVGWSFLGPDLDDWPGLDEYQRALADQSRAAPRGPDDGWAIDMALRYRLEEHVQGDLGERLRDAYEVWRDAAETEALNSFGRVGFELVSATRQVIRQSTAPDFVVRYVVPVVHVFCYFKRPALLDAPPAPVIGFQPPSSRR